MRQVVTTFYKFVRLADFAELRLPLLSFCQTQNIKGTILLALEGINGTIAGSRENMDAVLAYLKTDPRLANLTHRESWADAPPFDRLKVRLKQEIVSLGVAEADPTQQVGTYVPPAEWNALISDPEVLVIDTRNHYEVNIGSFEGANNPETHSFREFPAYVRQHLDPAKHPKVAMFCTGGIRCEKASAFMLSQGFQEVYHLQGGILSYLEEIPTEASLWQGECFVFDQRVAVGHGLEQGSHQMCRQCGYPVAPVDPASAKDGAELSCPHCGSSIAAGQS